MNQKKFMMIGLLAGLTGHSMALADSLSIKPGNWETVTQMSNPLMPEAQEYRVIQCITQASYDPKEMVQGQESMGCTFQNISVSGSHMSWKLECQNPMNPGSPVRGEGSATLHGDTGTGNLKINMELPGMGPVEFTTSWTNRRIGDC